MKAKLYWDSYGDGPDGPNSLQRAGTIVEGKECWMLVRNGHAAPADEECRAKANMSPDQLEEAKEHYHKLAMGRGTGIKKFDAPDTDQGRESLADEHEEG
jgi:hypothetical protein